MRKIYFLLAICGSAYGQSTQQVTSSEYNYLKTNNLLNSATSYVFTDANNNLQVRHPGGAAKSGLCDCMVPLDTNFFLAMAPNDDQSSGLITLPFAFDFYGTPYSSVYINNNGNVSFANSYVSFTAEGFPSTFYNMIAPFWGDADTRGSYAVTDSSGNVITPAISGGSVWYKITPTALIVKWENVGYFPSQTDKLNTFQLIISNGLDGSVSNGGNVSFCYGDMQWTTGSASSGIGGFGGTPATVGVNIGNGVDFFQIGRFDQVGATFDGPVGDNDGIDFLDTKEIYFNVSGASGTNTPPLLIAGTICDTIDVYTGDTLQKSMNSVDFSFEVTAGEIGQTVVVTNANNAPVGALTYNVITTDNNYLKINATFNGTGVSPGVYTADFMAVDNGIPAGVTHEIIVFEVIYSAALGINVVSISKFEMYPNPSNDQVTVKLPKGIENATVVVLDLSGKIILSQDITAVSNVSLNNVKSGMYLVNLYQNGNLIGNEKLIKK